MRNKAAFLSAFLILFLLFPCFVKAEPNDDDLRETIARAIKENPEKVIDDLKAIADTDDSAAMQYLIMLGYYQPEKTNSREFEDTAYRLHTKIYADYEKEDPDSLDGDTNYGSLTKDGYLSCYQNLECLIKVGIFHLSSLSGEWRKKVKKIVIPCAAAQKVHLTVFYYNFGCSQCGTVVNLSNCGLYPQYDFPSAVEEYREYVQKELGYQTAGSERFLYAGGEDADRLRDRYDPDFNVSYQALARPLESWAMESYPNYMYFSKVINHGIGFDRAVEELTRHYVKNFPVWEKDARFHAYYVMTPRAAKSLPVDKETLRYKILSGVPADEIKALIESKKAKGEDFDEPETLRTPDEILMIAIHRPDVLKMLIENCAKSSCSGLNTDVNAKNEFGKTALMYAAQYGFPDSVKILLDAGADINAKTNETHTEKALCLERICMLNAERTALMYAAQEGNLEIARYLVENGADINQRDSQGMTVFDYLSGKAPLYGNSRIPPTAAEGPDFGYYAAGNRKNKNVTAEQADEFKAFLQQRLQSN